VERPYSTICRLVTAYTEALLRELTARNVDLLITRRFGSAADERFDYEFLFADAYSVAAGAHNPWVRRRRIELADLLDEPWVLPPSESLLGSVATAAFRDSGLDYPRATVISEPLEVRISLLSTGLFISIFPDYVFRFPVGRAELRTLPVKHSMGSVPVGIVTLKNRTLNPVASLFIESAREVAKSLAKGNGRSRNVRWPFSSVQRERRSGRRWG
jgi:DNA-binding transcriptional LysR family regulator